MPDGDQLPVAGVDDRKLPAPGFLSLGYLRLTGLGHDLLPRRLEIVFAGVQVAAVHVVEPSGACGARPPPAWFTCLGPPLALAGAVIFGGPRPV